MDSTERGESAVQDGEGDDREAGKDAPFEFAGRPEDLAVAERAEPEQVNPKGEQGAGREDHHDDDEGDDGKKHTVTRPRRN